MSLKVKGTLLGIAASLVGVVLWIILGMLESIAGLAGALMGIGFIYVYQKINKEDKGLYPYIVSAVLIVAEIVIAELIVVAIIAAQNNLSFTGVLEYTEIQQAILRDCLIGVLFSAVMYGYYVATIKKRKQEVKNNEAQPVIDQPVENEVIENEEKPEDK